MQGSLESLRLKFERAREAVNTFLPQSRFSPGKPAPAKKRRFADDLCLLREAEPLCNSGVVAVHSLIEPVMPET